MTRQYSARSGIHVHRWVNTGNEELREFTDRMGQALRGKGNTYSLGTMTLSILTDGQYQKVRNRMSSQDRAQIDLPKLEEALDEALRNSPRDPEIEVDGLGLFGGAVRRGRNFGIAKLAFKLSPKNQTIVNDVEAVNTVFDDFNMPAPSYKGFDPHITMGEVYLDRLLKGQGENPHLLVPGRLYVPGEIAMIGLKAEIVDKNPGY